MRGQTCALCLLAALATLAGGCQRTATDADGRDTVAAVVPSSGDHQGQPAPSGAAEEPGDQSRGAEAGARKEQGAASQAGDAGPGNWTAKVPVAANRHALLVGCTQYQLDSLPTLRGPINDVPLFAKMLVEDFGFPPDQVKVLAGWPDDPKRRPTFANIVAAFEELVAKARPGEQLVILICGHGTQVPIPPSQTDPLDPKNPEEDGMDEVFLPADVKRWGPEGVENAIRDDQFHAWLTALRGKGAAVWIVFDCCHSGSMSRGGESLEIARSVLPEDLGVPGDAIAAASRRAGEAMKQRGGEQSRGGPLKTAPLQVAPAPSGPGSVVAFFASQPWEKTYELPRPVNAPKTPENYFGLLSYTLTQCLKQRKSPISYRELAQLVTAQYRSDRGAREPNPCFEGDLDREVMGMKTWPAAPLTLSRRDGKLHVPGGEIVGVTKGSVFAVHPPAGDQRPSQTVLGYVRVEEVGPIQAVVAPCAYKDRAAVAEKDLPELARCELIVRELGDLRLKLAVAASKSADTHRMLLQAMEGLSDDVKAMVLQTNEAAAQWVLRVEDSPPGTTGNTVVLTGRAGEASTPGGSGGARSPRVLARYSAKDAKALAAELDQDLAKLFRWQNLWRFAGAAGTGGPQQAQGVVLELKKVKTGPGTDEPLRDSALVPGTTIAVQAHNKGGENLWLTLIGLQADFSISVEKFAKRVPAWESTPTVRFTIGDAAFGPEGLVLLAVPMSIERDEPDFGCLEQGPLGSNSRGAAATPPRNDFDRFVRGLATAKGTRSFAPNDQATPVVLSWSWVTVAGAKSKQ